MTDPELNPVEGLKRRKADEKRRDAELQDLVAEIPIDGFRFSRCKKGWHVEIDRSRTSHWNGCVEGIRDLSYVERVTTGHEFETWDEAIEFVQECEAAPKLAQWWLREIPHAPR